MTDEQILAELGPLMWDAYVAFATDLHYWADMAEEANAHERRAEAHQAWRRTRRERAD